MPLPLGEGCKKPLYGILASHLQHYPHPTLKVLSLPQFTFFLIWQIDIDKSLLLPEKTFRVLKLHKKVFNVPNIQLLEFSITLLLLLLLLLPCKSVSPKSPLCYGVSWCYGVNLCYGVSPCYDLSGVMSPWRGSHGLSAQGREGRSQEARRASS